MPYSPFYVGGFKNDPDHSTPETAEFLNALEAAMTSAAALAEAAIPKPGAPTDKQVLYYDSATTSWKAKKVTTTEIDPAAGILGTQLAAAAAIKGSQIAFSRGAAPPGSPADGDIWQCTADATNGIYWLFRYNSGSASGFKWEFIGGSPLFAEVVTGEGTSSATYAALATAGPSITLPRAGDYYVTIGALSQNAGGAAGTTNRMSYDIGGTGAVDADAAPLDIPVASNFQDAPVYRRRLKTGLTAVALVSKYKTTAGTASFANRFMEVLPVRVS